MSALIADISKARANTKKLVGEAVDFLEKNGRKVVLNIDDETVRIAFYGTYNAGKSTIINALLAKKEAVTGDKPETQKAHDYPFFGFTISDLPGLDARIDESNAAHNALFDAHAVLYVISSSSGVDPDFIWENLIMLKKKNIPFIIVLNDKTPTQDSASERTYHQKLLNQFLKLADNKLPGYDWANRFFCINGLDAERGRIENKEKLTELSGIIPLEQTLIGYMQQSNPILRDNEKLRKVYDLLKNYRETLAASPEAEEIKRLEDAIVRCEQTTDKLNSHANTISNEMFSSLERILSSCKSSEDARSILEQTIESAEDLFKKKCSAEFNNLKAKIEKDIQTSENSKSSSKGFNLNVEGDSVKEKTAGDFSDILKKAGTTISSTASQIGDEILKDAAKEGAKQVGKEGAKQVAKEGAKQVGKEGAKQVGKEGAKQAGKEGAKQVSKTAGKALKVLGPAITIGIALWECIDGFKNAEKEKEAVKAREKIKLHVWASNKNSAYDVCLLG